MKKQIRGFPLTPKASDLQDHFGTAPEKNNYGPQGPMVVKLAREGVNSDTTPITPISNFNREINPSQVVAGDLDNTSYDASKIIKPETAAPKFNIKSTFVHEAVVKTPVQMGTQYETSSTQTMNRMTGQVNLKTVTVEKPIVGVLNNVREVASEHQTLVDINTGKVIDVTQKMGLHGTNPL